MEANKPNLILLNGPLGVGKSTLAKRYAQQHPLAVAIDIDEVRFLIGSFREFPEQSLQMAFEMAASIGRVALRRGHDIAVAQILTKPAQFELFEELADQTSAKLHEILLYTEKEAAIGRFVLRGRQKGWPLGYKPDGLIGRNGGLVRVAEKYDEMLHLAKNRPQTKIINSVQGDAEATYNDIITAITG